MDIKYNEVLGQFVNTANDEPVTQAELLEWAAANPEPLAPPKKSDPAMLNEVNEYDWQILNRSNSMLDKDGMEKSDRENVQNYLQNLLLMARD